MRFSVVSVALIILTLSAKSSILGAEDFDDRRIPRIFQDRAVVFDIITRITEEDGSEVWNQVDSKVTIPGRPVGIKLVGKNLVISTRLTPYFNKQNSGIVVAQAQIWIDVPGQGIHYQTTVQTVPLSFGDEVSFFPLGSRRAKTGAVDVNSDISGIIEILVTANHYTLIDSNSNSMKDNDNENEKEKK
jgi:hypothetical protein